MRVNMAKILTILGAASLGTMAAFQANVIPDGFGNLFTQIPLAVLVAYVLLQMSKRQAESEEKHREFLEKMMKEQRDFFSSIMHQTDIRVNQISDRIELLTQQIAVNTQAINEITKVEDLFEIIKQLSSD